MKAPDKIYLQVCGDCNANDCDNCKFEDLEDNVTWWKDKIFDDDIEYIRKDAFIKKACEVFCKMMCDNRPPRSTCTSLGTCLACDKFRKVLKGEQTN